MKPVILISDDNYFDLENLENNVFRIEDIAYSLSNLCRFNGYTRPFYSVAEHSVHASFLVPKEYALQGLLHDAAEAFLGDIPSPLKRILPDYKAIEKRVEAFVFNKLGIPAELHESVKKADLIMLLTEQRDLMPSHSDVWPVEMMGLQPLGQTLRPLSSLEAEELFLDRYYQIVGSKK